MSGRDATKSDAELVQAARGGDRDAFAALGERHAPRVFRYLVSMTGDEHVADDFTQESLRRALEKLAQLERPERFASWLLSIACNTCRRHLTRQVQREHRDLGDAAGELADRHHSALSSLVRREHAAQVALAIDRLPILLREAFVLFVVEGLPYAEIAAATDVAEGTLQVRVHRAKALLRQQLGPVVDTWRASG